MRCARKRPRRRSVPLQSQRHLGIASSSPLWAPGLYEALDVRRDHFTQQVAGPTGSYDVALALVPFDRPLGGRGRLVSEAGMTKDVRQRDMRLALEAEPLGSLGDVGGLAGELLGLVRLPAARKDQSPCLSPRDLSGDVVLGGQRLALSRQFQRFLSGASE